MQRLASASLCSAAELLTYGVPNFQLEILAHPIQYITMSHYLIESTDVGYEDGMLITFKILCGL